ncbi:MAG: hypothetical protein ABJD11_07080 [Gemmatimonadota bacterium]
MHLLSVRSTMSVVAAVAVTACTSTTAPTTGALLTVHGSAAAAPAPVSAMLHAFSAPPVQTGDPESLTIGMYALWISPNADCSAAVLVDDYGSVAADKDFYGSPVLFSGSPTPGSYKCVLMKMSDVIHMRPATSFSVCAAHQDYAGDIYRAGQTGWLDVNLNPIVGTGTDSVPADDHVTIVMTRDTAAAQARGFSSNQVIPLGGDLIVPGQSTFYWNGQGSANDAGGMCGVNPGSPEFR